MLLKRITLAATALVLLISGMLMGGCGGDKPGTYTLDAAWCQELADKITGIQPEDIPGNLAQDGGEKTGSEFDVNEYFKFFTHLSIKSGYLLDYVYYVSDAGGAPILYTRQQDQKAYGSFLEYSRAGTSIIKPENDVSLVWVVKDKDNESKYGSQLRADQTSQGYYEYTVLQLLGGQFYLYHKARIYDIRIVCTATEVEFVLADIENSGLAPIDESFKAAARGLDLQPVVEIGEETVKVSLTIFTMWGGFSRVTYTMNKDYPHSVTGYENNNILKYDCGITF